MSPSLLRACYSHAPIKDLGTLAETLGVSVQELHTLTRQANSSYRIVKLIKKDGTPRMAYDAFKRLKRVHQRIKDRILVKVRYPLYLQGGIRDKVNPRDYVRNAGIHAGQACVINEDIADFFPSVTSDQVLGIWENVFRFSPEVSMVLTALTTKHGVLPQGARTSSYLANLVFWRDEPNFVQHLNSAGFRYSRLADDITVSSAKSLSDEEKSRLISLIRAFIKRARFTPRYKKQRIYSGGDRMLVNNLLVNVRPALPEQERQAIRQLTFHFGKQTQEHKSADVISLASVRGKLAKLGRFHPRDSARLKAKLPISS